MRVLLLAVLFGSALVGAMPVDAAYDAAHAEHRPAEHPPAKPDMPQPQVEPQPQPQPQPQPVEPVASTNLPLSWTGGDASFGFEVYFIPIWPGQHQYDLHTITNTTAQNTVWNVPDYEDFPEDTTFILGVKDSTGGPGGGWYDLTSPATEFEAAIARS
ncbi:hypothetical protein CcaverHIS002_0112730 [Cutaneotrichosporon cavernicola]|nr:hypothetical protein CcaverHIS002_0112730 [Cutaneotrichosporon cavernicola]